MRPGSVTTATKIPRTTPRCVCSIVEVMVTNVGMATAKRARVNKSAHPTAEGTLSARYTQRAPSRSEAAPGYTYDAKNLSLQREGPLLVALRGSILNSPQGPQGGDLGLGQALDARDIEPLIGPVTAQGAQMRATLEIPEHDSAVIPATGQPAAIGTHLDRVYGALMRLSHPQAVSAVNLPPAQPAVTVPTDQHLPTRVPGHSRGRSWMPRQSAHPFPALRLPHEELSALSPTTSGCQPVSVRAPGHAHDGLIVSHKPS